MIARGSLVTIAIAGDFGKPRPALVVQSDVFDALQSVTVLLISSRLVDAPLLRITIEPDEKNGLKKVSQVMVDKIMTVKSSKIGTQLGYLDSKKMLEIERSLAVFLGIA